MGHIGNTAQTAFTSFDKQTITGDGTAVYTLSHNVANEQEIEVFVNNVRQEGGSGKAYTVSGNQITFSENIASTDTVYINFQGKAVQTVTHPSDQPLQATTGNFSSNVDVGGSLLVDTIKDGAGTNTAMTIDSTGRILTPARPAFLATRNVGITLTGGNTHQVLPFNEVQFDIGGNFSTSNNHYVCPVDGVYFFALNVRLDAATQGAGEHIRAMIYRGSDASTITTPWNEKGDFLGFITGENATDFEGGTCSGVLQCTAGDIVTAMGGHYGDTSITFSNQSQFSGFLVG